jgi:2-methylcitrate dehydratase PrpD
MDAIAQFADYVANTNYSDLPAAVVENTKKFIVDTIGVGIAGLGAPGCREAVEVVKNWGGVAESTVMFHEYKCPAPWAAFLNSIFIQALDFDDSLDESALHANVSTLPAALALAEAQKDINGRELICAVSIGQDVACRVGASLKKPLAWIRTATCGFFGATAATGKILKLNKEKMWDAFGISYCQTAGNAQCMVDGVLVKRMQPGFAAKAAILASKLAENGVTGTKNVFEGEFGFFKLYEDNEYDKNILLDGLGKDFRGMRLSTKPYPCCRMTHASIDAILELRKKFDIKLEDVEKIVITASQMVYEIVGMPFKIRNNPQVDAQFNVAYAVIVALLKGDVFINDFEEINVRKNLIADLTKLVEVIPDKDLNAKDMMNCSMEVTMKNGQRFSAKISAAKGNPLNPMSMQECMQKFRKCVEYSRWGISDDKVSEILSVLEHLEDLKDIRTLTNLLV